MALQIQWTYIEFAKSEEKSIKTPRAHYIWTWCVCVWCMNVIWFWIWTDEEERNKRNIRHSAWTNPTKNLKWKRRETMKKYVQNYIIMSPMIDIWRVFFLPLQSVLWFWIVMKCYAKFRSVCASNRKKKKKRTAIYVLNSSDIHSKWMLMVFLVRWVSSSHSQPITEFHSFPDNFSSVHSVLFLHFYIRFIFI